MRGFLATAGAVVAAVAIGLVTPPASAVGVIGHRPHLEQGSVQIRKFDQRLLVRANHARSRHDVTPLQMNNKLWKIAHAWAQHMARTGTLQHNPRLQTKISRKCPRWHHFGENVAYTLNRGNKRMFRAYMHSPGHRANILDHHFHQVGIATVKVVHHHDVKEWNVMDFADRC